MATAQAVIDSARYDFKDTGDYEYTDAELLDYLNRSVKVLDSVLASVNSDWVHSTDSSTTLSSGDNSVSQPSGCNTIRSIWISDDEVYKKTTDEIYRKRKVITATGQPDYYGVEGTTIIFERTADADYSLTIHYNAFTGTLAVTDSMPFNDEFNDALRGAVVLMAKNRNELSLSVDGVLYDWFNGAAMKSVIKRNYRPKRYYLGF